MQIKNHTFIKPVDSFAALINEKANLLFSQLQNFDIHDTTIDDFGKHYFTTHHGGDRLYFSIQSSADIIYQATILVNNQPEKLSFVDYGAGLGTLYLLAGMVGFEKVYFNDYFPKWAGYAKIISDRLSINITDYISGDIDAVIAYGKKYNIDFDIVASRNVVEHIYSLQDFYSKLYNSGLAKICYSTTTANYHNPAMWLKHRWYHRKAERSFFRNQREELIRELIPDVNASDLKQLVKITRGRAFEDFTQAVHKFLAKKQVNRLPFLSTNTCDCVTGVWAENLLTKGHYKDIIIKAGFSATYAAGFWDTHYRYRLVNLFTRLLNIVIKMTGKKGYWFSPFVKIVAIRT